MSSMKKFGKQSTQYFMGELIVMIAGLISFPILTRELSKEEYGLMALVTTTIGIINIVASAGLRPSLIRFYGEHKNNPQSAGPVGQLYGTLLIVTFCLGLIGTGLMFSGKYVLSGILPNSQLLSLLSFTCILVLFEVTSPLVLNSYRAEEKPLWYCMANIVKKYIGLVLGLLFLFYGSWRLYGFYTGIIIAEGIVFLVLIGTWLTRYGSDIFKFSNPIFRKTFAYGFPLLGLNISGFISNFGDRYIVQYYLGTSQVAVYSAGYTLCNYVQNLVLTPVNMALIPICMNLWESKKQEETKLFLSKFIKYFAMLAIPLIFGMTAVGKETITILASEKYTESAIVIPYVMTGIILSGIYFPILAGLFLGKRTVLIAILMFISAVTNVILNIILVPAYGIIGAAWSTVLSFSIYIILGRIYSRKFLSADIPYMALIKYIFLSIPMFIIVKLIHLPVFIPIAELLIRVSVGAILYISLLLFFDKEARELVVRFRELAGSKYKILSFLKPNTK